MHSPPQAALTSLEDYHAATRQFAAAFRATDGEQLEAFLSELIGDPLAEVCVDLRASLATDADREGVRGFLEIGFFAAVERERRLVWWMFNFDVGAAYANIAMEVQCEPYRITDPLFQGAPDLFHWIRRRVEGDGEATGSPDNELIDERATRAIHDSEVVALSRGFGRIAGSLAPDIPSWGRNTFPAAPRFVRLDPTFWTLSQPLMRLEEAAIAPANPAWMKTLALFPGESTYAEYALEEGDPKTDMDVYRDYKIRHIRRLEVRATRREANYLSMMIEELPRADESNGLMVGRCIHLDTRAEAGTPMSEAVLQHLDLAINVYSGADRAARMNNTLQRGKTQDATYRTHLYRIENIPFPALFTFTEMFVRSKVLFREWATDLGL